VDQKWTGVQVKAPTRADARSGDGWKLELKPGWRLSPGARPGDLVASQIQ
jgi:hypothetical protein